MIDLSSANVWPSTRDKAGKWATTEYVRQGGLTLWDAANLLSYYSYGGVFSTCSKATKAEVVGLYETLRQSVKGYERLFEGYPPLLRSHVLERDLSGIVESGDWVLDVYPVIAFRDWHRRTGIGDGRYFESNAKATASEKKVEKANQFQYSGDFALKIDTPRRLALSKREKLTVEEFAAFYCGIDIQRLRNSGSYEDPAWVDYINPLVELIEEKMLVKPRPTPAPTPQTILKLGAYEEDVPF